jgi:hypothetical protein
LLVAAAVATGDGHAAEVWLSSGKKVDGLLLKDGKRSVAVLTDHGVVVLPKADVSRIDEPPEPATPPRLPPTGTPAAAPAAKAAEPAAARSARRVGLALSGQVGGQKLDALHDPTRTRLAFFLAHVAQPPCRLIDAFESGGDALTPAQRKAADLWLVIEAKAALERKVEFYDLVLGFRYRCNLTCRIERRTDNGAQVLDEVSLVEDVMAIKDDSKDMAAVAYQTALESLCAKLASLALFRLEPRSEGGSQR